MPVWGGGCRGGAWFGSLRRSRRNHGLFAEGTEGAVSLADAVPRPVASRWPEQSRACCLWLWGGAMMSDIGISISPPRLRSGASQVYGSVNGPITPVLRFSPWARSELATGVFLASPGSCVWPVLSPISESKSLLAATVNTVQTDCRAGRRAPAASNSAPLEVVGSRSRWMQDAVCRIASRVRAGHGILIFGFGISPEQIHPGLKRSSVNCNLELWNPTASRAPSARSRGRPWWFRRRGGGKSFEGSVFVSPLF